MRGSEDISSTSKLQIYYCTSKKELLTHIVMDAAFLYYGISNEGENQMILLLWAQSEWFLCIWLIKLPRIYNALIEINIPPSSQLNAVNLQLAAIWFPHDCIKVPMGTFVKLCWNEILVCNNDNCTNKILQNNNGQRKEYRSSVT